MASGPSDLRSLDLEALTAPAAEVDAFLRRFLAARPLPANLRAAVEYVFEGGGKRMRPLITLHAAAAVGGSSRDALAPAAAIELVHAFSLVHDDLPAMDDDDLRRGRPTLHRHTDEAMAILAGDLMFGLAFEIVAREASTPELAGRIVAELATAANDMIAGQVYDTLPDFGPDVPEAERLETVHANKTGALIRCAARMGAVASGASAAELDAITTYAEAIGLMFQVVDDLLDVTQTTEHLGKTAGKDLEQGKLTYPSVHGLERSRDVVAELRERAHRALGAFGDGADGLRGLCDWIAVRTR